MRVFSENPDGLLKWLASHRDLSKNRVVTIFESLFSEGIVDKYKLYQQIQDMPAGSDKEYLEKLTGQWGVAGAVGWLPDEKPVIEKLDSMSLES